jgi:hypothetical protein
MLKFFNNYQDPRVQIVIVYLIMLFIMLCAYGIQINYPDQVSAKFYWLTCTSLMLFYSVFNSIGSLISGNLNEYWGKSMYSFGALAVAAGYTAYFFSGINIFEAGSYSWLFKVVFFVYLVFMSMVRSMKIIVEFAQKEEWNAPKFKNRKR